MRQAVGLVPQTTPAEHLHHIAGGILVFDPAAITEDDVVVAAAPDIVLALAAEDYQRQGGSRCVDGVVVGPGRAGVIVVVRSLRVHREELVGDGAECHGHGVVAKAGVEGREGAHVKPADLRAGVLARAGDGDHVVGVATPDRDAASVSAAVAERVEASGGVVDVHRGETADLVLRDHHGVGDARTRIAYHQRVGTCAGVDVEQTAYAVERAAHRHGAGERRRVCACGSHRVAVGTCCKRRACGVCYHRVEGVLAVEGWCIGANRPRAQRQRTHHAACRVADVDTDRRRRLGKFKLQRWLIVPAEADHVAGEEATHVGDRANGAERRNDTGERRHVCTLAGHGKVVGARRHQHAGGIRAIPDRGAGTCGSRAKRECLHQRTARIRHIDRDRGGFLCQAERKGRRVAAVHDERTHGTLAGHGVAVGPRRNQVPGRVFPVPCLGMVARRGRTQREGPDDRAARVLDVDADRSRCLGIPEPEVGRLAAAQGDQIACVHVRVRRHNDPVVAGRSIQIRDGARALYVENVVAGTQADVQRRDPVVVDAVVARGHVDRGGAHGIRQRCGVDRGHRLAAVLTLEGDGDHVANPGHRHVVRVGPGIVVARIERIEYRAVRIQDRVECGANLRCRRVVGNRGRGLVEHGRAARLRHIDGEREAAAVGVHSECLDVVHHRREGTFTFGGDFQVDRLVVVSDQAGKRDLRGDVAGVARLHPDQLGHVLARHRAGEGHRIGDGVGLGLARRDIAAHLRDDQFGRPVQRLQRSLDGGQASRRTHRIV